MGTAHEEYCRWREGRDEGEGVSTWGLKMNSEAADVFAHLFSPSLLTTVGKAPSERETASAVMELRKEGNRRRDGHDGVTDRLRGRHREREMRETEWGLPLRNVRISLQDKEKIDQFPQC